MNTPNTDNEHVDTAALAGAVLAGVLASFVPEGPFDCMSAVLGVTLVALLLAYLWNKHRTVGKSIAFSMVAAFSSLLVLGFVLEIIHTSTPTNEDSQKKSQVPRSELAISWAVMAAAVFMVDRAQEKNRQRT